jgi:asparagine synthase (glutamine-hydrolysing)
MCGILGHVGKVDEGKFLKCLNTLTHRGPDGYGVRSLPGVTFGHRRLSILDISERGSQPMSYQNERYWVTFNGEIYNFIEIRKELIALGYSFVSDSDTEVILASFVEWKEKCLDKFNGMWAFAIFDKEDNSVFLSRDRFGVKPLYYATQENLREGGVFVFASEMKAITPFLKTITPNNKLFKDLDRIFYYESTEECLIKEIKRFPAGHYAWIKNGEMQLRRFWNTLDYIVPNNESYINHVQKFKELFVDACSLRMRSDVTMGTALSGGLDSSAIFSTVAYLEHKNETERAGRDWQHAFCASFPDSPVDEKKYAQKVTDHLGVNLDIVTIDPTKDISKLYEYLYLFEDMYLTSPIPFVNLYGEMRKQNVKVTLDGHGADEFFGGYHFDFLHILYSNFYNPKALFAVFKAYFNSQSENVDFRNQSKVIFVVKTIAKNFIKNITLVKNQSKESRHPTWKKLDYFTQKLFISSHETVLPTLLRNYDRYSMINGVEIRMPFMDYRLVTFALSLPWSSKIRNGYTKSIIRDGVKDFMPHDVTYRTSKIGWNSPTVEWMKGPLKNYFQEIVESSAFKNSLLVDNKKLRQRFYEIINNSNATFADGEGWWLAMSPFFWEESFLKRVRSFADEVSI